MKFNDIDDGGQRSGEAEAQHEEATVCFALLILRCSFFF